MKKIVNALIKNEILSLFNVEKNMKLVLGIKVFVLLYIHNVNVLLLSCVFS